MGPITEFAVEVMDDPCGGKTGNALGSSEPLKRPDRKRGEVETNKGSRGGQ